MVHGCVVTLANLIALNHDVAGVGEAAVAALATPVLGGKRQNALPSIVFAALAALPFFTLTGEPGMIRLPPFEAAFLPLVSLLSMTFPSPFVSLLESTRHAVGGDAISDASGEGLVFGLALAEDLRPLLAEAHINTRQLVCD